MKQFIPILAGALLVFVSFVNAEEVASSEAVQTEQQPSATQTIDEANKVLEELTQTETPNVGENAAEAEPAASQVASETTTAQNAASTLTSVNPVTSQATPVLGTDNSATNQAAPALGAVDPDASNQPVVQNNPQQAQSKKPSIWDKFLNLFKASEPKARTCEEAFNEMEGISINFANTTDFAISGDKYMDLRYQKIKDTNAFNTRSSNLYIDISNLNVESSVITAFIGKWSKIFSQDKKTVLWNLSENKSLGDDVIDNIDLSNTYSLNLANTSVSDLTVTKIVSILSIQNNGMPVCINLSGTKVSDAAIESLKAALQKAKTEFESKNPGKVYSLEGENNSGVIFKKLPNFLKPALKKPIPVQSNLAEQSATALVATAPEATTVEANTPVADTAEQSTNLESVNVNEAPAVDTGIALSDTPTSDIPVSNEAVVSSDSIENAVDNETTAPSLTNPSILSEATPTTNTSNADTVLSEADKLIAETEAATTATEATA